METPFMNDPFAMVWIAYKRLYDKPCEIWYDRHLEGESVEGFGFTNFPDDGSKPQVFIYTGHPTEVQVETLAHELAHVVVGVEHEHDTVWEEAFEAIFTEYNRVAEETFGKEKRLDDHEQ